MNKTISYVIISFIFILLILLSYMFYSFIGSVVLGIFLYYISEPIYKFLRSYNIRKTYCALTSLVSLLIPIFIILLYTLRIIGIEIRAISRRIREISDNPELGPFNYLQNEEINTIITSINSFNNVSSLDDLESVFNNIDAEFVGSFVDISVDTALIFISSLSDIFFTLFIAFSIAFYSLKNGDKIKSVAYDLIDHNPQLISFWDDLNRKLQIVYIGNIGLAIFTSLIGIISYTLISYFIPGGGILRYPALIGILCGLASIIPVFGSKIIYMPITIILYIVNIIQLGFPEGILFPTVFIIVSGIIIDLIPDLIVRPKIGSMGGVSTGIVLLSFVLGPLTFGWFGLFLGPLVFVIFTEFVKEILPEYIDNRNIFNL